MAHQIQSRPDAGLDRQVKALHHFKLSPLRSVADRSLTQPLPALQGHLAHRETPTPRTLQKTYAYGPMEVLGGGSFL
jgi:hypothetical protein